jgi:hypothetical protein
MQFWWMVPGFAVVVVSALLTLAHVVLAVVTRRPYPRLTVLAVWLRQVGFGILFLGLGASVAVPALLNGPDVGLLLVGALLAGMGGLFFIAASDPIFKPGRPALRWPTRKAHGEQKDTEQGGDS